MSSCSLSRRRKVEYSGSPSPSWAPASTQELTSEGGWLAFFPPLSFNWFHVVCSDHIPYFLPTHPTLRCLFTILSPPRSVCSAPILRCVTFSSQDWRKEALIERGGRDHSANSNRVYTGVRSGGRRSREIGGGVGNQQKEKGLPDT